jgi:hypothetical protein
MSVGENLLMIAVCPVAWKKIHVFNRGSCMARGRRSSSSPKFSIFSKSNIRRRKQEFETSNRTIWLSPVGTPEFIVSEGSDATINGGLGNLLWHGFGTQSRNARLVTGHPFKFSTFTYN